jgi:hypothetical protein
MWTSIDVAAIARRIRALIAGEDRGDLAATARRLGVELWALRRSIDVRFPQPSVAVMKSILREYAIHPLWLLYGAPGHAIAAEQGSEQHAGLLLAFVEPSRE